MTPSLSVLHVVESYGGGVATALQQYVRATPDIRHILLRAEREGDFVDSGETLEFETVHTLPRGVVGAIGQIRNLTNELRPDVIHAHSSFAGLFVRLGLRASRLRPIVYTPHGYAFERADVSRVAGMLFRLAEQLLSVNTTVYAACSPRESNLSSAFRPWGRIVYVPNVVDVKPQFPAIESIEPFRVVTAGRLTPARDPLFLRDVVNIVHQRHPEIKFTWVGGGEERYVSALTAAGVEVTGWLPRDEALQELGKGHLHFHPAAWDGFPMVLLEANALKIPSLVRSIPAFLDVPSAVRFDHPGEVAARISKMSTDRALLRDSLEVWDDVLKENVRDVQSARLRQAYEIEAVSA